MPMTAKTEHRAHAVVLVSGGIDSAVALACARRDGFACHALSFDYGQRHAAELEAARRVAANVGAVDHRVVSIDLRAIGGSALTDSIDVPKDRAADQRSSQIPVTYVPARNLIFLSVAVGLAEVRGAWDLFVGVNAVDYSGYPDCRAPFIESFTRTANLATKAGDEHARAGRGFIVHAPLVELDKAQIIRLGADLGVDFSLTHSCYDPDGQGLACGACDSCRIRRRGFQDAGVSDPTRYAPGAEPRP